MIEGPAGESIGRTDRAPPGGQLGGAFRREAVEERVVVVFVFVPQQFDSRMTVQDDFHLAWIHVVHRLFGLDLL